MPAEELPEELVVEGVVDVTAAVEVAALEVATVVTVLALTEKVMVVEVARFPARSRATANVVYVLGVRVVVAVKGVLVSSALSF